MRRVARLLACVLALTLLAAACGGDDSGSASSTTQGGQTTGSGGGGGAPSGEPIKLAAIVPFSGPQASLGQLLKQGADLAVETINADGGVLGRPLQIEYKDDQAKTDETVRQFRETVNSGTKLTFGYPTSAGCIAVAPIAEQLNGIMMSSYCQTNKMGGENFSKNFFRATTSAEMLTRAGAKAVEQKEPNAKTWVSIAPDYEYGHNTVNIFKNEMRQEVDGFNMAAESWPPFQSPTYTDYITKVANVPADGVFSTLFAGDMLNMLKQQKPFNLLQNKVFLTLGMDIDVIKPMAQSGDVPNAWDSVAYYYKAFDNPTNTKFVEAFQKKYGEIPTLYPAGGYWSTFAYAEAIKKAGSADVDKVKKALEGLEWDTPLGKARIRPEDHQAVFDSIAVIKIKQTDTGEKFEIEDSVLVPGADVTSPPNPGKPNPFDKES